MGAAAPPGAPNPAVITGRWLVIVLASGLIGGIALDRGSDVFHMPEDISRIAPNSENPEDIARIERAGLVMQAKNAALGLGLAGWALGAGFGLGIAAPAWRSRVGMLALVAGVLCGGLIAAVAGGGGVALEHWLRASPALDDGQRAMLVHGAMWSLIALGIGFVTRLPGSRVGVAIKDAAVGMIGGILGAVVYTPLAAILFPLLNSSSPVPEGSWNRMLWVIVPDLFIGLLAARTSFASAQPAATESAPADA